MTPRDRYLAAIAAEQATRDAWEAAGSVSVPAWREAGQLHWMAMTEVKRAVEAMQIAAEMVRVPEQIA